MIFDIPGAIGVVERKIRGARKPAVKQVARIGVVTDQPAPGAFAYQRTDACFTKHPRQSVAARASHLVYYHHLWTEDRLDRCGDVRAFAQRPVTEQRPAQVIDDVVGNRASAVVPLVDDGSFLANLGKVVAIEIREAPSEGVGQVDISDAAAGQLVDPS